MGIKITQKTKNSSYEAFISSNEKKAVKKYLSNAQKYSSNEQKRNNSNEPKNSSIKQNIKQ